MNQNQQRARAVIAQVCGAILGKQNEVREAFLAFLADGHILLEDIPGVGKTTLARAFSKAMALDSKRVQFTPDVLPSDLTGFSIYRRNEERFVYQPGSVFCNLLLADELNRTSPKTQSALLEVMEERRVSVDGVTRAVPQPFLVIATQNPTGAAGTQLLPEAQVDRFMISMSMGYPAFEDELAMAMSVGEGERLDAVQAVIGAETLLAMQHEIHTIYMKPSMYQYLLMLVTATRQHPSLQRGASPRATIALVKMAKAAAWLEGRDYVIPSDIATQLPYILMHRISRTTAAKMEGVRKEDIILEIVKAVKRPPAGERVR